jgi:hypothetical protein
MPLAEVEAAAGVVVVRQACCRSSTRPVASGQRARARIASIRTRLSVTMVDPLLLEVGVEACSVYLRRSGAAAATDSRAPSQRANPPPSQVSLLLSRANQLHRPSPASRKRSPHWCIYVLFELFNPNVNCFQKTISNWNEATRKNRA